jgi:capsular polysaccharide export protein
VSGDGEVAAPFAALGEPASARTFLLVSAPFGPFSRELAATLRRSGARVLRVTLNGGDRLDWGAREALTYKGAASGWRRWLERAIVANDVTDVVAYGDSTPHTSQALEAAAALGLRAHVLEQGYFRPHWVTLERGGVNANSGLPRDPDWYRAHPAAASDGPAQAVGHTTPAAVVNIIAYHTAMYAGMPLFPRYRAPYSEPALRQGLGHVARLGLQQLSRRRRRQGFERLLGADGPIFLCALQRPGDSQLCRHSDFLTAQSFADYVVASFAAHAPANARLLVRPHPLDPGLIRHADVVARAAARAGAPDRVRYIDHGKLHEVLPHMSGVVCVNSTAGLAAIEFGKPTITLGRALYDMPGMTHQGGLDGFWTAPQAPDAGLYAAFRRVVMAETQINGAYATRPGRRLAVAGVAARLLDEARRLKTLPEPAHAPRRSDQPIAVPVAAGAARV